jgi:hypothetical protein
VLSIKEAGVSILSSKKKPFYTQDNGVMRRAMAEPKYDEYQSTSMAVNER